MELCGGMFPSAQQGRDRNFNRPDRPDSRRAVRMGARILPAGWLSQGSRVADSGAVPTESGCLGGPGRLMDGWACGMFAWDAEAG